MMNRIKASKSSDARSGILDSSFFTSGWYLLILVGIIAMIAATTIGLSAPSDVPNAGACFGTQSVTAQADSTLNSLITRYVDREGDIDARSIRVSIFIEEPGTPTRLNAGDTVTLPIYCRRDLVGSWNRGK